MSTLRILQTTAHQWAIPAEMPGVLHAPGAQRSPGQTAGVRVAGSHRATAGEPWPGASVGVRRPFAWETPLSAAEVAHAFAEGVL